MLIIISKLSGLIFVLHISFSLNGNAIFIEHKEAGL